MVTIGKFEATVFSMIDFVLQYLYCESIIVDLMDVVVVGIFLEF